MRASDKTLQNVTRSPAPTTCYGLLVKALHLFVRQSLPRLANAEVGSPVIELLERLNETVWKAFSTESSAE